MNIEFKKALENKRILLFSQGKQQIKKELQAAESDLAEAGNRYDNDKYKYATITGYYLINRDAF